MAHVVVTIAGRTYRMTCEEGQEGHIEALGRIVEEKILSLREGFGDIGEQRIVVMAALSMADEVAEARAIAANHAQETAALRAQAEGAERREAEVGERAAKAVDDAAERLERLVRDLQPAPATGGGL